MFDDLAHEHEDTLLAGPAGLGHVVGYDEDRVLAAQLPEQLFHGLRTLGIQRRAGLVHEQHLRLHRKEARDAELLLFLERKAGGLLV